MTYQLDGQLPHFIRVQSRIDELREMEVLDADGDTPVDSVREVTFDNVSFAYEDERVLDGVSFSVEEGEKIALVGSSGAGKSTIVSLLGRLQTPDGGRISRTALRSTSSMLSSGASDSPLFGKIPSCSTRRSSQTSKSGIGTPHDGMSSEPARTHK